MGLGAGGASRLAAEGCTSTGATMSVTPRCCSCAGGGGGHCVVVNVYVNNNVQGVTNSVLVGSKVAMRDPGARVAMTRRPRRGGGRRRKVETNRIGILAVVLMCVCVAAAAAAAVICLNHFARGARVMTTPNSLMVRSLEQEEPDSPPWPTISVPPVAVATPWITS
ncbi:hypothetical protein BS78_K273700 [Paspalum vaginatum]|uniref:Uncharacterized protein n=1 Tax=Paspalum vaginatum TaxID=158149 RepID=A0A9W8CEJ1_9POAL|nr:hypothetical protein BS78_K273700 [Paspalum vaginatum]